MYKTKYIVNYFFTFVIACGVVTNARAQNQGRWYQVEMLIFKRFSPEMSNDEKWRNDLTLIYPDNLRSIENGGGIIQPRGSLSLSNLSASIRADSNKEVLFHKSWQQKMYGKHNSPWIAINGGEYVGANSELSGSVKVHIGRFLHLTTDLWLTKFGSTFNNTDTLTTDMISNISNNDYGSTWPTPPLSFRPQSSPYAENTKPPIQRIVTLRQHRAMRSGQTHYIDHPLMGVLIRFSRL